METPAESAEAVTLHGVRVIPQGRITPGFRQALGRLARRGYGDPGCTVVKTAPGPASGITHAGGRYVHPRSPAAGDVREALGACGIGSLEPPFIVTPGPDTLYHEWGHHVDRVWSRDDHVVLFSFRWFSWYYAVAARPAAELLREWFGDTMRFTEAPSGPSELDGARALPAWYLASSELFADLFEDWMQESFTILFDRDRRKKKSTLLWDLYLLPLRSVRPLKRVFPLSNLHNDALPVAT